MQAQQCNSTFHFQAEQRPDTGAPPGATLLARRRYESWLANSDVRMKKRIRRRWTDLFDLVLDLKSYPDFVPHCRAVRVLSRSSLDGKTTIVSRMTVGMSAIEVSYANRTVADAAAREIMVGAIDGPFDHLRVLWKFTPDGDEWTEVEFVASYKFNSRILAALASGLMHAMFGEIIGAFERRADRLFKRNNNSPYAPAVCEARWPANSHVR
jgi:coenzyme Q-binding protein COQ10